MEYRPREAQDKKKGRTNFGRAAISGLKKSRKGKHHDLMGKIMEDLRSSEPGFAVEIPLVKIEGVSVLNLRSAIIRAAAKDGMQVSTSADEQNFYVWKAPTRKKA